MSAADSDIGGADLTEDAGDLVETKMTYDDGKWHWLVVTVWVGALTGFLIYAATLLIPSLSSWGAP